jgi:hypothetical protein
MKLPNVYEGFIPVVVAGWVMRVLVTAAWVEGTSECFERERVE